jgi:hypothetical protein
LLRDNRNRHRLIVVSVRNLSRCFRGFHGRLFWS